MRRFAGALRATILPDGTMRPGGERTANVAAKALDVLAGIIAFKVGSLPMAAGTYSANVRQRALVGGVGAAEARASFGSGAPRIAPAPVALPLGRLGTGVGSEKADTYDPRQRPVKKPMNRAAMKATYATAGNARSRQGVQRITMKACTRAKVTTPNASPSMAAPNRSG